VKYFQVLLEEVTSREQVQNNGMCQVGFYFLAPVIEYQVFLIPAEQWNV